MKTVHPFLICLVLISSFGAIWDSVAVKKVRDGIQLFRAGEYSAAAEAFDVADSAEPDNETIAFDQACALTGQGELEDAKELFQQVALARETSLSSAAYYNQGNLSAAAAKETLGADPIAVEADKREEVISGLLSAVGHYRDCLRIQSNHAEARHNLELIRLFVKHIQAEWEKRDRRKAREELGLLEFLAMIEQRQEGLRNVTELLAGENDSPHRRQAVRETADSQRRLHEEIEPLKQKIAVELQSQTGQQQTQTGDDRHQQIQTFLNQLADDTGDRMLEAADQTLTSDLVTSQQTQRNALDQLNEIFMIIASFAQVLERSVQVQDRLVQTSEGIKESSVLPTDGGSDEDPDIEKAPAADAASTISQQIDSVKSSELVWKQSRISDWGRLLSLKAEMELPQVQTQIKSMTAQADEELLVSKDEESVTSATPEDPAAQLKSLVESLNKAVELAPQVEEYSASAEQHLASAYVDQALPDQQQTLRLLKEIAEPLADQNQQNSQQEDGQNQNDEEEQQQDSEEQTQQDDQKKDSGRDETQEKQQQSLRERAERVLRRAREREREHRDREKELRMILRSVIPVEKDW